MTTTLMRQNTAILTKQPRKNIRRFAEPEKTLYIEKFEKNTDLIPALIVENSHPVT